MKRFSPLVYGLLAVLAAFSASAQTPDPAAAQQPVVVRDSFQRSFGHPMDAWVSAHADEEFRAYQWQCVQSAWASWEATPQGVKVMKERGNDSYPHLEAWLKNKREELATAALTKADADWKAATPARTAAKAKALAEAKAERERAAAAFTAAMQAEALRDLAEAQREQARLAEEALMLERLRLAR